ncbi:uncharacterized protein Dyak_GE29066 [Drosophila yakuba]|uniref:Coiled-coil domain-containing protein 181 n=1 Tax=Drosophila yakuba TaxID=7245 RepID=A0A0R1E7I5_DROYA|nr:uncharacterized protein Dyak_GE29066 [Drosophila yakuba]
MGKREPERQKDLSPSPPDELPEQLKLKPIAEEEPAAPMEEPEVDEVEEEICEEIVDLSEVPQQPMAQEATPIEDEDDFSGVDEADLDDDSPAKDSIVPGSLQLRQSTFDQDDSDQKSLTNLLTESDCEEEERTLNEARQKLRDAYKNLYKTLDPKQQATIDRLTGSETEVPLPVEAPVEVEEEDDLSIIVASYIPDDFELNEQSIYYKKYRHILGSWNKWT